MSFQQWASLGPEQALRALGAAYMSSLAGLQRRWALALASLQDSSFGTHTVRPEWHTDDWTCLGCNRSAKFTRDPKWATKECPAPVAFTGSFQPFFDVQVFLERLEVSIRFLHFPHPLSDSGLPVLDDVLDVLRTSAQSLSHSTFAGLLGVSPDFPRLAVKHKDCLLRWKLLLHNRQHKGHAFVPATLLATDGYCVNCRVRPKDFQSFLRRPCKAPVLSSELSTARAALLEFPQALSSLSLLGGWAPVFTGFGPFFPLLLYLLFGSVPFFLGLCSPYACRFAARTLCFGVCILCFAARTRCSVTLVYICTARLQLRRPSWP